MIELDVKCSRPGFTLDVQARSDARALGVFGPSGAGKTTIINLIAGLERPDEGRIEVGGTTVFDSARGINVAAHQRRMGVVFQEHRLFPHLSVRGNLLYGAKRDGAEMFERVVKLLELGGQLERKTGRLSGGEQQRVAIGRAVLSRPKMLLLDEPMSSLDEALRRPILVYLKRVRDELDMPILYVSHDLSEILQLTEHLLVLERGGIRGCGRFSEIVHQDEVLGVVRERGMTNVLRAQVIEHKESEGLSLLAIGEDSSKEARLFAPQCAVRAGTWVTIALAPWDVALATGVISGVSIQNQIAGIVTRCTEHARSMLVEVHVGTRLIVEISKRSAGALGVCAGKRIECLIKSHAVKYLDCPSWTTAR